MGRCGACGTPAWCAPISLCRRHSRGPGRPPHLAGRTQMFHALFILALIAVLGPLLIGLVMYVGLLLGVGISVAGEQLCQGIEDLFDITIRPIGERIGWFTLTMSLWGIGAVWI